MPALCSAQDAPARRAACRAERAPPTRPNTTAIQLALILSPTALAYMRVVMRAQMLFNKQYGHYATSLTQLVHTSTFTQRMVNPERGDYTVGFKGRNHQLRPNHDAEESRTPSTALFMPRMMARSTPTKARPPTPIRKLWKLITGKSAGKKWNRRVEGCPILVAFCATGWGF
jgi:hypothetical protein